MKRIFFVCVFFSCAVLAIDKQQIICALSSAATNQAAKYVEARASLLELGTNATHFLSEAATDTKLTWQQRLVARICMEHIVRCKAIQSLREYDWFTYYRNIPKPGYNYASILGEASEMGPYVVPKFKETGLWYYFLELTWKQTSECAISAQRPNRKSAYAWPTWCREALKGQPEEGYLSRVIIERLQTDTMLQKGGNVELFREMLKSKEADAVPVLVANLEAYVKKTRPASLPPNEIEQAVMWETGKIMDFADSRHSDLLKKTINGRPMFIELIPKLTAVRARSAPAQKVEPTFRLGTNEVSVAQ